jgi:hypothetical protein
MKVDGQWLPLKNSKGSYGLIFEIFYHFFRQIRRFILSYQNQYGYY